MRVTDDKWKGRYLELAKSVAGWSKDPRTSVGACIVGQHGQIVSQGYNGFPRGIDDDHSRLTNRETKLRYVVHAELNAILNALLSGSSTKDSSIFVAGKPVCHECAKAIIQAGIKHVVYDTEIGDDSDWRDSNLFALQLLKEAGIEVQFYDNRGDV